MINWLEALITFKTIAEQAAFSAAARKLNINTARATILIQQLEKALNAVLFVRTTRRLKLTEEGHHLLMQVLPLLEEWDNLQLLLKDKVVSVGGTLTIGAVPNVLNHPPFSSWFSQFLLKNPRFAFDLKVFRKPISLIDEELDLFVGFESNIRDPAHVVARTLLNFNFACYAAPSYIKKYGMPKKIEDIPQHNCLIFADKNEWHFKEKKIKVNGNFHAEDLKAILSAACEGLGIIRAPDFLVRYYLENKSLAPVLDKTLLDPTDLKLFYPKLTYQPRKIKEFISYLMQQARPYSPFKRAT